MWNMTGKNSLCMAASAEAICFPRMSWLTRLVGHNVLALLPQLGLLLLLGLGPAAAQARHGRQLASHLGTSVECDWDMLRLGNAHSWPSVQCRCGEPLLSRMGV